MSSGADGSRRGLLQELLWTRTGLLLLILILVSVSCLAFSSAMDPGTVRNLVASIGTGTTVSAIVGFGQTLITTTATQRALVAPVIDESRRTLQELSAEYRSLNQEFFPTHVFEATTDPDPAFNHLMMEDLHRTRQYFFSGFSGRYAAVRLLHSHAEWDLRVVVADPRDGTTISGRTKYLLRREGAEADRVKIQERLHDEIWIGLVGLFLARSRCTNLDLTVVSDPPLDRLEMFDESVWITLYSDSSDGGMLYPRTLRFSEGSFIYNMERAEFLRVSNSRAGRHFQINPETTREEFIAIFDRITGSRLSDEQFANLEERFHSFRQEFSAIAELGG